MFCTLLFFQGDLYAQVTWENVYPVPDAHGKCAVASPLAGQFIVVGAEGRIWRSIDDGVQWSTIPSPATAKLNDVIFSTTSTGCTVGEGGVILRTEDAGEKWELVPCAISATWSAVTATDSNTFIAVGSGGNIVRSEDGGRNWISVAVLGEGAITDIAFATETLGAAVGDDGLFAVTTDGGRSWTTQSFSHLTYEDLRVVEALDDSTMVVCSLVDYCAITLYPDSAQIHDLLWREPVYDMYYQKSAKCSDGTVWLVGYWMAWCQTPPTPRHGNLVSCTLQDPLLRRNTFGLTTGTPFCPPIRDVAISTGGTCIAIAEGGAIIRGDTSWLRWTISNPAVSDLNGLVLRSDSSIFAFGASSVSVESTDGGKSWYQGADHWVSDLTYMDENTGFMLHGYLGGIRCYLHRTSDGGEHWTPAMPGSASTFMAVAAHPSGFCLAMDSWQTIYISSDGGSTWRMGPTSTVGYSEISMVISDEDHAHIILHDLGGSLGTSDRGRSWYNAKTKVVPSQGYSFLESGLGIAAEYGFELTRDAGESWTWGGLTPFRVTGVHLADSTLLLIVGEKGKSALSRNLGRSWEECEQVTSYDLLACRIIGSAHCIAVGENGTVLYGTIQSPTPIENTQDWASDYQLQQNYPNPFNPSTTIEFSIPRHGNVRLAVFDHLGREVAVLAEGEYQAGTHSCQFSGSELQSGVYMYRLNWNGNTVARRMVLLK